MQTMKIWHYVLIGLAVGLLLAILWAALSRRDTVAPTVNDGVTNVPVSVNENSNQNTNTEILTDTSFFSTNDLPDRDPNFDFSASLPTGWAVEYVSESRAVSLFDPTADGGTSLEKSKVFVTYFEASTFLTLMTVNVKSETETTINTRPAVTYMIEKKSNQPDFPNQPSWRNAEHRVTDIRSTDDDPAVFYAFAKAPDVSDALFDQFLSSISFSSIVTGSSVVYPLESFTSRITKKEFGQLITPQNSPVQPERFSGYHAGADAEILDGEADRDVPVYAIADGTVTLVQTASGYGGVVMIEHSVDQETVTALYGHVRIASVRKPAGQPIQKAEQIAVLGTGNSTETDGERKHLHFAILKGSSQNIRGYVSTTDALSAWEDPVIWLSSNNAAEPTA